MRPRRLHPPLQLHHRRLDVQVEVADAREGEILDGEEGALVGQGPKKEWRGAVCVRRMDGVGVEEGAERDVEQRVMMLEMM